MSQLSHFIGRRTLLGGMASVAVLSVAGCSTYPSFSLEEAVRRLLFLSTDRAFARLLAPGGFWDDQMTRLALPEVIGSRGGVLQRILTGPLFKDRLQRAFNDMAYDAAERAAPAVTDAVRTIGVRNALALLRGSDPMAATSFLHQEMGSSLVEIMVPEFGDALRVSQEPLVGQVLAALTGVDVGNIANSLAYEADNAIFRAIGREEAAIRADPRSTNDPVLMAAFGLK
ncbi:hypothetical protein Saro_2391 [Novosphingobium aromaticivorans DSM 12444]|uniref:DUF4197 domain-containing protein n=1 Tax=Novosphingobium aromaticivorans (strain ATCC 700278 / DSM 12444 / CCUG 56034 / CIP 105152 / NBRC 16084 / F199) TaxID=279238 RepID=Q2G5P6_NOVAD|nr:DUF4197 domain-containing protein [Novosphingobium aromaticivorans]ABD26827.1 hypothetical protein Saro_2391 [Novosphingobium aromaticivorans DSM 12444]SCY43153.1 Protein of unknown function [Novosphingobium aromaticivorans]